jgi:hypothetical protein
VSLDSSPFDGADLQALAERGISIEEATRQIQTLRRPACWTRLDRPCTVGDGIRRLDQADHADLLAAHREAADAGRFSKFVPASGAATRMFRELLFYQRGSGREQDWNTIEARARFEGDPQARTLLRFVTELERFAFFGELERTLAARGEDAGQRRKMRDFRSLLDGLLDTDGMDYDALPKGRLLFHRDGDRSLTSFEEHLIEAAQHARSKDGVCRLHLTVSEEHREGFERLLAEVGPSWSERLDTRFAVDWSHQKPSTDTLAVDTDGKPFRDASGRLVFRPGGHGALIENLGELGGDLVYIKNIDNVQPERGRDATVLWKKLLGGLLVRTEREAHRLVRLLGGIDPEAAVLDEVEAFARDVLSVDLPAVVRAGEQCRRAFLASLLHRPLRVCGVVPNTGEPGGGPFWVRSTAGEVRAQIVESSQVDPRDSDQQGKLTGSTHFNPVDLVCALRDVRGARFDLSTYVDPDTAIVTSKSSAGRDLRALERPGLWNGAMAGWNTLFVEVPLETFTPVKSVMDLLREEHQG